MTPLPESPRCLSPFQGNLVSLHCLDFQTEDRDTPRWHGGQPCGKASVENLVGKPRGKATDPLIHAKGSVKLLLQLGRKAHLHAPNSRQGPTPMGRLQKYPKIHVRTERNTQVPAPTPHKVLGPGINGRGILRDHRATRMGTGFPEVTRAGP